MRGIPLWAAAPLCFAWVACAPGGEAGPDDGVGGGRTPSDGGTSSVGGTGGGGDGPSTGGAPGSPGTGGAGGGSGGAGTAVTTPVCAVVDENAAAQLQCPEGQRIESVSFASYGTPGGECEGFVAGACDAAGALEAIEDLCVGRARCTVPATNSMFSDPCSQTVKQLAVEVACVVGEPTVAPAPYKGIANSPAAEIDALGASWCYNWTTGPSATDCGDPLFVPMIWGGGNVAGALEGIAAAGYDTVLGFNEPNKSDQANMSVAAAIAAWPALTSNPSIRVGSPAVSDDGRAWLESFMAQVESGGLRVDFIAMHWYGWNAGSCTAANLEGAVNWASQWNRPIWITEFGCMGSSNTSEEVLVTFFEDAVEMLEEHPLVERYAWYPWNTYNHLYLPDGNDVRQRTALGDAFLAAPATR